MDRVMYRSTWHVTWRAGLGTWTRCNKTANGALCDVAHRHYQGVLYFENSTQFHGTHLNVIPFTPYKKYGLPCVLFSRNSQTLSNRITWKLATEIDLRLELKCGLHCADFHETHIHRKHVFMDFSCRKWGKIPFTPLSNSSDSVSGFSRNSQTLNTVTCRSYTEFHPDRTANVKSADKFYSRP